MIGLCHICLASNVTVVPRGNGWACTKCIEVLKK